MESVAAAMAAPVVMAVSAATVASMAAMVGRDRELGMPMHHTEGMYNRTHGRLVTGLHLASP